jgi:hypothetical protein
MWPRRARRGCCSGPISQRESAGSTGCRACSGLPAGSAAFRPGKITLRRRSPEVLHWRGRVKPLYFADVPALHGKDDRDEIVALCGFLMNRRAVAVHRYCCGTPSTANVRNVAYLSPILRTSFVRLAVIRRFRLVYALELENHDAVQRWRSLKRRGLVEPASEILATGVGDGLARHMRKIVLVALFIFDGDSPIT